MSHMREEPENDDCVIKPSGGGDDGHGPVESCQVGLPGTGEADSIAMQPGVVEQMRGLHKEIWEGIDIDAYIDAMRGAWEDPDWS